MRLTPKRQIRDVGSATVCEGDDVMELQPSGFATTPLGPDECALALVALPNRASNRGWDVT
jgi:hypothetical protein